MDKETIIIASEDVEIIDASEYKEELSEHFGRVPEVAKHLLKGAKTVFSQIEKSLYTAPAFINAVKAAVPDVTLQAMLTDEQKQQIAKGYFFEGRRQCILCFSFFSCQPKQIGFCFFCYPYEIAVHVPFHMRKNMLLPLHRKQLSL